MRKDSETTTVAPASTERATRRGPSPSRVIMAVVVAVLAGLAFGFPQLAPNAYILSAGVVIVGYACTATAWNFMGGFTGYISLGHAAMYGLGAYGTGILIRDLQLPSFVALLVSAAIVLVLSVPIGIAALRVRGASFVIVTISFVLIMLLVFQAWSGFTGGSAGLSVPRPFPDLLRPEHHQAFYYLYLSLLVIMLVAWWLIDRSSFGMALKGLREDEDKAQALGVPTRNYKLVAYVISATFTALAGGLYALWFGDLDPIFQFSILLSSYMVLMSLFGGVRHLFGPVIGAVVIGVGLEVFKLQFGDTQFHLVATGLLLGVVVLFMPDGVIPAVQGVIRRFGPESTSIREMTAGELLEHNRAAGVSSRSVFTDRDEQLPGGTEEDER